MTPSQGVGAADRIRAFVAGLKRLSALRIVIANAIPIVCVILFGWPAGVLLLLYWCENVIVGAVNGLKMAVSGAAMGPPGWIANAFLLPFYVFHYGMFCFVHGVFVLLIGSIGERKIPDFDPSPIGLFHVVENLTRHEPGFLWSLAAIAGLQLLSFAADWLARGKFRDTNPMIQMFEPYGRIVVLHLAIMAGMIPVLILGGPVWALVGLAIIKTLMELGRLGQFGPTEESLAKSSEAFEQLREKLQSRR
ncbi:MAG: hypothetical protein JWR84_227 [Caulobacter sp.]|nr:hypothetical protein [Caulobacter sp.]